MKLCKFDLLNRLYPKRRFVFVDYRAGLNAVPGNAKMHYNWANFLRENGQRELSVQHYKEALR